MANALSLDERVTQAQEQLRNSLNPPPSAPISTPNDFDPSLKRVIIPTPASQKPDSELQMEDGTPYRAPTPNELLSDPTVGAGVGNDNALPDASPEDTLSKQIADRKAQAIQALKDQDGFDGYTPSVLDGGQGFTEDDNRRVISAVTDIAAGFNASLAKTLSLPRTTVDQGLAMLGLDYMQSGRPAQHTIDALNRMGIPAYEVETLANKIGQGALPALATWATMQLAAPSMAAKQGFGTFDYLLRNMGEWMVKHPVVGLWLGQTSQAGGETAVHVTGKDNLAVRMGGELLGGVAPTAVKYGAKLPLKAIPGSGTAIRMGKEGLGKGLNAISDALPTQLGNVIKKYNPFYKPAVAPPEPLVNNNFDTNRLNTFSNDQVAQAQHYQDLAIEQAINSIPRNGTPAELSTRTQALLQQAEKISKRIVSSFWDRVPKKSTMDVRELRNDVYKFREDLRDLDNQRPDAMIDRVIQTVRLRQEEGSGKIVAPRPTLQKLRDLQSQIGTAITEERAKDAPREGMVRNLARLSDLIDDAIVNAFPNNTSIQQARAMSKRHNDLFSRGPVDAILSKRRSGDFRVPQADAVDSLLTRTDGLAALKAVQDGIVGYPKQNFVARATQAERDTLDQMVKSATDAIRSSFREAADQGPQKAVAFSQRNEDQIKALGGVAGELQFAAQKISAALDAKKGINASALNRFAQFDGEKAVQNIFAQKDPAGTARQLMVSFRGDPDALEGLRNQVLKEFIYNKAGTNPNVMAKMLKEPRIERLMEAVLKPDQINRLNRMVNTAVRIGAENEEGIRSFFKAPFRTSGRLIGAQIGRKLAPGTLQGPSLISNAVGKWAERTLQGTDPTDLLAQAVLDPQWEAMLYSRIPQTTQEMQTAIKTYRRIFAGLNSAEQRAMKRFEGENGNDE